MREIVVLVVLSAGLFSGFRAMAHRTAAPTPSRPPEPAALQFDAAATTAGARSLVEQQLVTPLTKRGERLMLFSRAGPRHPPEAVTYELDAPTGGTVVKGVLHVARGVDVRLEVDTAAGTVRVLAADGPPRAAADYVGNHAAW